LNSAYLFDTSLIAQIGDKALDIAKEDGYREVVTLLRQ